MGFLSRLFGGYEEEKEEVYINDISEDDVIYVNGEEVTLDEEAKDFLRQYDYYLPDAQSGVAEAQLEVGKCLIHYGERFWYGLERKGEAVHWLEQAAEQKISNAYTYLGRYYTEERFEDIDMERGLMYLNKGIECNDPEAWYCLGDLYEKGERVTKDISKAIQYKEKAASLGNVDAAESLGMIFYEGELVAQNKEKAFPYLKSVFEQGKFRYGYYLACCYMYGYGVEKNEKKAVETLQAICGRHGLNAKQNEAYNMLIDCYENGTGTEIDYAAANEVKQMRDEAENMWETIINMKID